MAVRRTVTAERVGGMLARAAVAAPVDADSACCRLSCSQTFVTKRAKVCN